MNWFKSTVHFFWPFLEKMSSDQETEESRKLTADKYLIQTFDLSKERETALDEARRIADMEEDRRRGSDQKASTYLAVVATLVPLLVTLATAVWDKKVGSAPIWLNVLTLTASVIYVSAAGVWAFRVLQVSVSYRIGVRDVADAWSGNQPVQNITRTTLRCARLNQNGINKKVTAIKFAHEFLLRAFLTFSILLMLNIAFFFADVLSPLACDKSLNWLCTTSPKVAGETQISITPKQNINRHPSAR
jgi:hypothetical protein